MCWTLGFMLTKIYETFWGSSFLGEFWQHHLPVTCHQLPKCLNAVNNSLVAIEHDIVDLINEALAVQCVAILSSLRSLWPVVPPSMWNSFSATPGVSTTTTTLSCDCYLWRFKYIGPVSLFPCQATDSQCISLDSHCLSFNKIAAFCGSTDCRRGVGILYTIFLW